MNDQLKQRLVGAIVLVSLAVIFIPMILPGGGLGDSMNIRKVPPEPDYRFPPPKSVPKAPPMSEAVIVPMGDTEPKVSTKASTKTSTTEKKTSSKITIHDSSPELDIKQATRTRIDYEEIESLIEQNSTVLDIG